MDYDDVDLNIVDDYDAFGIISKPHNHEAEQTNKRTFWKKTKSSKRNFKDNKIFKDAKGEKVAKNTTESTENATVTESQDTIEPVKFDFRCKLANTFQEKLSVLEERDKHLRATIYRDSSKNMNEITAGTCPDMCPEKERLLREIHCFFSLFEGQIVQDEIHVVPELLVKEYSRSSADQEEPLPHELRPEPVLVDTMCYILINIVARIDDPSMDVAEWYNYCWDRLRSLRKDIIQQQLCSPQIVELLEQSARFHICCFDRLSVYDLRIFDPKINAENLVNCLQMLITMYEDLEDCGIQSKNETEFRIYMMLLLFESGDIADVIKCNTDIEKAKVKEARNILFSFKLRLYTKFFKLVKKTSYLNQCILQRYFNQIRAHTLDVFVNAYSSGNKPAQFPISFAQRVLELGNEKDTANFAENYGFKVDPTKHEILGFKASFCAPDVKPVTKPCRSVEGKRPGILEAVTGVSNFFPSLKRISTKVHSSFGPDNMLREQAWDASDQKNEVIKLYGNIYDRHQVMEADEPPNKIPAEMSPESSLLHSFQLPGHENESNLCNPFEQSSPPITAPHETFSFAFLGGVKPEKSPLKISSLKSEPNAELTFSFTSPLKPVMVSPLAGESIAKHVEKPPLSVEICSAIEKFPVPLSPNPVSVESIVPRNSRQILEDLSNTFCQFETTYWSYFGVKEETRIALERLKQQNECRKLRKLVKRNLKRQNAKKIARIWRKKVEIAREKYENFEGVQHLSAEQYVQLWGVHRNRNWNIVEDIIDSARKLEWSSNLLLPKPSCVKFIGDKLAQHLWTVLRTRYRSMQPVFCFKLLLHMPKNDCPGYETFYTKICEFCRLLFYKDSKKVLGDVQVCSINGCRILTSINVKNNLEENDTNGLAICVLYVNDRWESKDDCLERLTNICGEFQRPIHVSLILTNRQQKRGPNGCEYQCELEQLLSALKRENIIQGWTVHKWKNFFSIPKVVLQVCSFIPEIPAFHVENLRSFIENIGTEFFCRLHYLWKSGKMEEKTPYFIIQLYNKFLERIQKAIEGENLKKYNLSREMLDELSDTPDEHNNLINRELLSVIRKYSLLGFTKWPPNSTKKLVKVISKYCNLLNKNGSLLPNVLRMINPVDDVPVEILCNNAPWLEIVELWFRHNVCLVSEQEYADKLFLVYEKKPISNLIDEIWLHNCIL